MSLSRRRWLRDALGGALGASLVSATVPASAAPAGPIGVSEGVALGDSTRRVRRYVQCRYGQLHVTSTGPRAGRVRRPGVVCLPMSPRSGRDFDELALTLGTDRWVHAPDLPGFGGSDPPPAPPAIDEYAEAVIEGLRAMGIGRGRSTVDFIGQHTGAAVTIEVARRAPELVRRIVFIGVPLFGDAERETLRAEVVKPRPYFEDPDYLSKVWQRELATVAAGMSRERMFMRFTEIMRAGAGSWWGFNAVFNYPTRERLPGVSQPVLSVVLNERLGPATRDTARLVQRGEVLELTSLPGSALDTAPAQLAQVAREFFDRA